MKQNCMLIKKQIPTLIEANPRPKKETKLAAKKEANLGTKRK